MIYNQHLNLNGKHAFLGASVYRWLNYDENKLLESYANSKAQEVGTALHDIAASLIKNKMKLSHGPKDKKWVNYLLNQKGFLNKFFDIDRIFDNLVNYVNDAIGFLMDQEVLLYYSDNCFGTTDAIRYDERTNILRISDLKTGVSPVHMDQLEVYAALFLLEYGKELNINLSDLRIELRIYQNGDILYLDTEDHEIDLRSTIFNITKIIISSDRIIEDYMKG